MGWWKRKSIGEECIMSVTWEKGRGQVEVNQLQEFEDLYQVSFPATYKKLVSENNGGYPSKTLFTVENGREAVFESLINWDKTRKANIYFWHENLALNKVIPFGKDPFGNLICFDFNGYIDPTIKFWDHETGKVHFVSENFEEFLNALSD